MLQYAHALHLKGTMQVKSNNEKLRMGEKGLRGKKADGKRALLRKTKIESMHQGG